ncbi:MAG: hypothetical protein ACJ72L_16130 [Marmoricola sp.]
MRGSDPTLAEQIAASEQRLAMLDALHAALEHRDQVMAIIGDSADVDASRRALQELLELDELQANCVLDAQLRRFSEAERLKIALSRRELQEWLDDPVVQEQARSRRTFRRRGWIRYEH